MQPLGDIGPTYGPTLATHRVMRSGILLLLVLSACNAQIVDSSDSPASVRERLTEQPTRLLWTAAESAGSITVMRRLGGGTWETGLADLKIDQGEVVASADPATGTVTIEKLSVVLEDIAIPPSVFNREASLSHVRAELTAPALVTTTWIDDDEAELSTSLDLAFSWALTVEGNTAELGSPDLPPVSLRFHVTGDGSFVHVDVDAGAAGELWSWAGLVKLQDLNLVLRGETP